MIYQIVLYLFIKNNFIKRDSVFSIKPLSRLPKYKPIIISRFYRNGKVAWLGKDLQSVEYVRLDDRDKIIDIEFVLLDYQRHENHLYSYILKGFEKTWHTSYSRNAVYKNLPPGKYELCIKAILSDGKWSKNECKIALIKTGTSWHTVALYSFCLVAVILVIIQFSIRVISNPSSDPKSGRQSFE